MSQMEGSKGSHRSILKWYVEDANKHLTQQMDIFNSLIPTK